MPEPNGKDPKEQTAAELAASYGKGGQGAKPPTAQGKDGNHETSAPLTEAEAKAKAEAEARAKADLAAIARLTQVFVHNMTVLKGAEDNDLLVLNDLEGHHLTTLVVPKRVSRDIVEGLS